MRVREYGMCATLEWSKPEPVPLLPQAYFRTFRLEVLPARPGQLLPCTKYGRFPLKSRYNVDQVPLPFIVGFKSTWEFSGADRVWIRA